MMMGALGTGSWEMTNWSLGSSGGPARLAASVDSGSWLAFQNSWSVAIGSAFEEVDHRGGGEGGERGHDGLPRLLRANNASAAAFNLSRSCSVGSRSYC